MVKLIETVYNFLWGDLLTAPLPGGGTLPLSLLVILLIPTGVYFTIRTKFLPIRLFKDMVGALFEKKDEEQSALSVIQTLIVSTATRVGMGNLVGVVAAISAGGAGAVFWMWVTALIGSSTAFIVLRKNATVKVLDIIVPIMAGFYLLITLFIIITNITQLPGVFERIFSEAFGFRQVAAGGFGAVLMNGIKRGLFSNEAGSGSAPCAAAAAVADNPVKVGLTQALGVFIDTLMICSCTAMIMLLTPTKLTEGLVGMDLLQKAMEYHLGSFGVIFIAITLWLFSFSTFIGILFYARSNVAYLFGDNWFSQTAYKVLALAMLFVGGLAAYTIVWDLGDVGIGLMTIFNIIMLYPLSKKALNALKEYEKKKF